MNTTDVPHHAPFLVDGHTEKCSAQRVFIRRFAFHLFVGSFVVIISFLYGISAGLQRGNHRAFAAIQGNSLLPAAGMRSESSLSEMDLPAGVTEIPFGEDITLNSKQATMASFITNRSTKSLVDEQALKWKRAGAKIIQASSGRRGFVLGLNQQLGKRYWLVVSSVPPELRHLVSQGMQVQGYVSVIDANGGRNRSDGAGEVPGVPVMPGGIGGAVFSSVDVGGRSYSSIYTNPGTVEESLAFYRNELTEDGWVETQGGDDYAPNLGFTVGSLTLRRGAEEVILLFSPVTGVSSKGRGNTVEKTGMVVTRGPIQVGGGQVLYER